MKTQSATQSVLRCPRAVSLAVLACGLFLAMKLNAQISVLSNGAGPLMFETIPAATEFTTGVLTGSATTYATPAAMDAGVQTVHVTNITRVLPLDGAVPPGTFSGGFRYNTSGQFLESRPTTDVTNAANLLLATLQNNSGANISSFNLSYDFGLNNPLAGEIPGFRVFYSLTGIPGSWQMISSLSGTEVAGRQSAVLPLGFWEAGSTLFLLWADDNANSITDPSYTIDNFAVTSVVSATVSCISITNQPSSFTINERASATFRAIATGYPQHIQWYRNGVAIGGANGTNYTTAPAAYPADNGSQFYAVITNSLCTATSSVAVLTVLPDTVPPRVVSAVGSFELDTVVVTFSEAVDPGLNEGSFTLFPFGGDPEGAEALLAYNVILTNTNTVAIVTTDRRNHKSNYSLRVSGVFDASSQQNSVEPDPTIIPYIAQDVYLVASDGTKEFRYYQDGSQDNSGWKDAVFSDASWAKGANVFSQFPEEASPPPGFTIANTTLNPTSSGGPNTIYFRAHFELNAIPTNTVFRLLHWIDDGAVFYLNGKEAGRVRMPTGPISFNSAAASPAEPHPAEELILDPTLFVTGENLLAVEVHQVNSTSTDIVMGIQLQARISQFRPGPAKVVKGPVAGQLTLTWFGSGILEEAIPSEDGKLVWTNVAASPVSPYTFAPTGPMRFFRIK